MLGYYATARLLQRYRSVTLQRYSPLCIGGESSVPKVVTLRRTDDTSPAASGKAMQVGRQHVRGLINNVAHKRTAHGCRVLKTLSNNRKESLFRVVACAGAASAPDARRLVKHLL